MTMVMGDVYFSSLMNYSNMLCRTPVQNRSTCDRLLSPTRQSPQRKLSMTPDRDSQRKLSRLSMSGFLDVPDPVPCDSPRPSVCKSLFVSRSHGTFSPSRRQSLSMRDSSGPASPPASPTKSKKRWLPMKPISSLVMKEIPRDYYISPLDWSCQNVIALAGSDGVVRLVNPKTLEITPIDKTNFEDVECVKFSQEGTSMVVGSSTGPISFYDVPTGKIIKTYRFQDESANAITVADWRDNMVIGGTRCGKIIIHDTRESKCVWRQLHIDEVCAVRMSPNMQYLATSGNDSSVKIWDMRSLKEQRDEILAYDEHDAACRGLAWSPYNDDIIISGGGTSDRTIRMWNTVTGETIRSVDTGSQVCNLHWNEDHNEILSTHGYSQNHIALWKAGDFKPIGSIHTHKERVLYMAVSPDGSTVATAGEDSYMQMWKFWPQKNMSMSQSLLVLR